MLKSNKTLNLIEALIEQYEIFVSRCNSYIDRKAWEETNSEIADEGVREEGEFQDLMIKYRDKIIILLANHKRAIDEYKLEKLAGFNFNEDLYLQEEFIKQYETHINRLKNHLANVKWNEKTCSNGEVSIYHLNDTLRYKEGKFQGKMIEGVNDMLINLEKSIGIDPTIKVASKRGGSRLNPFTEEVLLGDGIKPIDQPNNLAYKDWLINCKEPDIENKREYIDFWKKHLSYAITGLTCGGVPISGILYWQLNFMKIAPIALDEFGNAISKPINPLFRDNEFYIDFNYSQCEKDRKYFFGVGCRRFSKSAFMTAVFTREAYLFKNSRSSYNSLSVKEIEDMEVDFNVFVENRPSCFADIEKIGAFGKIGTKVQFAIQLSENSKKISYSEIRYLNLSNATSKSENAKTQKGAGGQVSKFALEEAGKSNYNQVLTVMKPAISTNDGQLSCSPIIMATGGDTSNSKDLEGDFLNAGDRGYFVGMHKEYAQYVKGFEFKQLSDRQVGFFVPDVMSMYAGKKKKILFSDYINKKFTSSELKELEDMYIYVTDWENAKKKCAKEIEDAYKKSEADGDMMKMFLPSQPEDCFIYKDKNPFNIILSKQKEQYILDNNLLGEYVELSQLPNKEIVVNSSEKKPYLKFPTESGKNWDAPAVIFEHPIVKNPPLLCYVAGFDGYRIGGETTTANSFGSLYVIKCIGYEMKVVASYTARPTQMSHFLEQCRLLLEYYNAMCLAEREDLAPFQAHLEIRKSIRLLNREISTDKGTESAYRLQGNKPYGQSGASSRNKQYLHSLVHSFCNEQNQITDEFGNEIEVLYGIETIPDLMLHRELQNYGKGNFDRYWAWAHALMLGDYVVRQRIVPRLYHEHEEDYEIAKLKIGKPTFTSISRNSVVPKRK